ncbi:gremlin-1-like [Anneissia japonica]|uniref:gremlin-1-like n=1 Tax=Anneissia japonica TaxID=1529436 RepID=UPI001425B1A5|nr:gremlin-1-like [Anneissia japonica]XP_033105450.1 gremlin-1-like [Anneissia japonica]
MNLSSSLLVCIVSCALLLLSSLTEAGKGRRKTKNVLSMLDDSEPTVMDNVPRRNRENRRNGEGSHRGKSPDELLTPSSEEAIEITEKQYLRGDWCKTQPVKQLIEEDGCISRTITNRFCYGQCNSFYVPKTVKDREQDAFVSCAFCKPYKYKMITVTLRCPGRNPNTKRKKIKKIKQCRCIAIDVPVD